MAGNIFINYRRDDSSGVAGRLHDRMAQSFGSDKLFMDVDNIPVGMDFEGHLKSQVAACDAMVAIIGPNWLDARDETGLRRLDNPDDFVTIEIATALARNIPVIPVLLDGARMPKATELPDRLKPLARRQAFGVRHAHFGQDAESLIAKMRVTLGQVTARPGRRQFGRREAQIAAVVVVMAALSWFGWNVLSWYQKAHSLVVTVRNPAEDVSKTSTRPSPEKVVAAEKPTVTLNTAAPTQQTNAGVGASTALSGTAPVERSKQEEDRQAKAAADTKRKADEAITPFIQGEAATKSGDYDRAIADYSEAIRLNPLYAAAIFKRAYAYEKKGDQDRALADYNEAIKLDPKDPYAFNNRGLIYEKKGDQDRALADYSEAIKLNPRFALAFYNRGLAYARKGDNDRALADYSEAIKLDPKDPITFNNRGLIYERKGDRDLAVADYNEAIRLDPKYTHPFYNRAHLYWKKGDYDRAIADFSEVIKLDPKNVLAILNRGNIYGTKGDHDLALADFNEVIKFDPKNVQAVTNRGLTYSYKGDNDRALADYSAAIRLNPDYARAFCNRGILKRKIKDESGDWDVAKAKQLDPSSCR